MTLAAFPWGPRIWFAVMAILVSGALTSCVDAADAPAKTDNSAAEKKEAAKEEDENKNEYLVAGSAPAELLEGIHKLQEQENNPKGVTREQKVKDFVKIQEAIVDAATRILDNVAADEKTAAEAFTSLATALSYEVRLRQENAGERLTATIAKYRGDKRPKVATEVRFADAKLQLGQLDGLSEKKREGLLADILNYFKSQEPNKENLNVAMSVADGIENVDPKLAAKAYADFANYFATSQDEKIKEYASKMEGSARRLNLPGHFMEIDGTKVDGEKFDWSSYRGKIVLVDFWATWCGPCVAELPNVKKNYELYHDKGFEVVGISLDDDRGALEKFLKTEEIPWSTIYSDDPKTQGWNAPLASYYGIMGIPSVFLLDKDGKVISMNARGERLGAQLAELLGPPGEAKSEPDDKKAE